MDSKREILEPGDVNWDAARRAFDLAERGFFTHAAGRPTDTASAAAIEAQLALVAGALAPYGAYPTRLGG